MGALEEDLFRFRALILPRTASARLRTTLCERRKRVSTWCNTVVFLRVALGHTTHTRFSWQGTAAPALVCYLPDSQVLQIYSHTQLKVEMGIRGRGRGAYAYDQLAPSHNWSSLPLQACNRRFIPRMHDGGLSRHVRYKVEIDMKPVKKTLQDSSARLGARPASTDTEEVWVPGIAALAAIFLTGLLYLALPPDVIVGPNWPLLAIEGVFVEPLIVDALSVWNLSHAARRVLVPLCLSTLSLVVGVALFILTLPAERHATDLLRSAALLWCFNILVFALWYWELDGGGPGDAATLANTPRISCSRSRRAATGGRRIFSTICSWPLPGQPR